jgi:hypothetical protein
VLSASPGGVFPLPGVTGHDLVAVDGMGRGPIDGSAEDPGVASGSLATGIAVDPGDGDGSREGGDGLIAEQAAKQNAARVNPSLMRFIHQVTAVCSRKSVICRASIPSDFRRDVQLAAEPFQA